MNNKFKINKDYINNNLEIRLRKDQNISFSIISAAGLVGSISSGIIYNNILPSYKEPIGLLSGSMFLISLGFGALIVYNSKMINKLKKENEKINKTR